MCKNSGVKLEGINLVSFILTQATLGRLTSEGNHSGKQIPLPDLGVNNSINDYHIKDNTPQTPIFNARIEENNFAGYQNPLTGGNRIFATEEIGDFIYPNPQNNSSNHREVFHFYKAF